MLDFITFHSQEYHMAHYAITWRVFSQLMWIVYTKPISAGPMRLYKGSAKPIFVYHTYNFWNFISVTVCVLIYTVCNMNLPCKSCIYSYSLGVYLIYTNIYNFSNVLLFIQYIYIIYFKSIFIKTITSFLFGDVIHKPHSFISFNPFPPRGSPLTSKIVWH